MESQTATPTRPHAGGREDCWSEGATETLIEAWGDRYVRLNRGNLRQKDWKEVADTVNSRQYGVKPQRTDVQCKNRIDTLKKKYKLEKTKSFPSKWPFYNRLDYLIGTNNVSTSPCNRKLTAAITLTVKSNSNPNHNFAAVNYSGSSSRLNSSGSNDSSHDDLPFGSGGRKNKTEYVGLSEETTAYKELARAILRFGEIYERIESSKQQQMMELEKQRMEFTTDLEVQRMNMFMETQLQIERAKRPARHPTSTGTRSIEVVCNIQRP
ncbi:trihelix transcription factor ENAP2-like isoform X1 [Nicotiana tomentosiformis]|uniref:trihelix transcription factor ENAP2-like isoform X1 n=1 Tax=Nicotiana tomentosiformis TaxID=4098 RepID=UPI00051B1D05|nr:trihelix transcription factor ASIL2-like isoform X1 [Nicotiana tomentosiformis]XP_033508567.1 trihelix transcription factor ASIL2-like isoform X1 [Nicotiana tomentosiformis]